MFREIESYIPKVASRAMELFATSEFLTRGELTDLRRDLMVALGTMSEDDVMRIAGTRACELMLRCRAACWSLVSHRESLILGLMGKAPAADRVRRLLMAFQSPDLAPEARSLARVAEFLLRMRLVIGVNLDDVWRSPRIVVRGDASAMRGLEQRIRSLVAEAGLIDDPIARVTCLELLSKTLDMVIGYNDSNGEGEDHGFDAAAAGNVGQEREETRTAATVAERYVTFRRLADPTL